MPVLPSPTSTLDQRPIDGAAGTLTRMAPALTVDGWWIYYAPGEAPASATPGARVDSGVGYDVMLTTTTTGLRTTMNPNSVLFFY